jgi:hypothetical protein
VTIAALRYSLVRLSVKNETLSDATMTRVIGSISSLLIFQLGFGFGYHYYKNIPVNVGLDLCLGRKHIQALPKGTLVSIPIMSF